MLQNHEWLGLRNHRLCNSLRLALGMRMRQNAQMDFTIIGEITSAETFASGSGI